MQKALDVTGQNLMNIDTPGYTRQRVDQEAASIDSYRNRFATPRSQFNGMGVDISGIAQTRDTFLDKRFRESYADVSYHNQVSSILGDIDSAIDEYTSDNGLKNAIQGITKSLHDFASQADSETFANLLATSFQNMTQLLHQFSNGLDKVMSQQKYDMGIAVNNVNDTLQKIAQLNKTIAEDQVASKLSTNDGYGPNSLLDQRNLLIDELSQFGSVSTVPELDGTVTVSINGHVAVKGWESDQFSYYDNNDGTVALDWKSTGETANVGSGALKAYVDYLNGRGTGATGKNESIEKGVLYYQDKIDTFARVLADKFNHIVPELNADGTPKVGADGNPVYKTLLGALVPKPGANGSYITTTNVVVDAANISISDEWMNDKSYVIYKDQDLDASVADKMLQLIKSDKIAFHSTGETFTGTFGDYVEDYTTGRFAEESYHIQRGEANSTIADDLLNRRSSVAGVSREEEGTNMMMYQKSFQAVSRLMTAMDEALDVLINRTGMVGR